MPGKVPSRAARAFAARLSDMLKDLPSYDKDRDGYRRRIEQVKAAITDAGGTCREQWYTNRVSIHGISATGTSGIAQACRNWIAQVTTRSLAAAQMAGEA